MNLGETIYKLRMSRHMSQGDLADALDVSRQSISKWETNSSVPELDKLIKISEIFEVSLDALILNRQPLEKPQPQVIPVEASSRLSTRKIVGTILLCFGALVWLMITLLGDILSGLIFASPFLTCGLICLYVRKHTGLWCCWSVYCIVDLYLRYATGANWRFVFWAFQYSLQLTAHVIVAWAQLLCFVALTAVTVLRFRTSPPASTRKNAVFAGAAWVICIACHVILALFQISPDLSIAQLRFTQFLHAVFDWIGNALFVAATVFTVRTIILLWKKK